MISIVDGKNVPMKYGNLSSVTITGNLTLILEYNPFGRLLIKLRDHCPFVPVMHGFP